MRGPSHTKKGPGRRHLEGDGSGRREEALVGNKLARKAYRRRLGLRHK